MKAILMSIQPKWCELIESWKKRVEVRKSAPQEVPFKAYIYQTKKRWIYKILPSLKDRQAKVIGEFVCNKIEECIPDYNPVIQEFFYNEWEDSEASCLTAEEQSKYGKDKPLYGWHISDLKIYDKPKELSEFKKVCPMKNSDCAKCEFYSDYSGSCTNWLTRPPQSWCYVEELC